MSSVLQLLLTNAPVLSAIAVLSLIMMWFVLTTRSEFKLLRKDMDHGFLGLGKDMEHGFKDVRAKMDQGFKDVRAEMDQGFKDVRAEMDQQGKDIRAEMKELGKDIRAEMNELGKDIRTEMKDGFTKRDYEFEKTLTTLKISRKEDPKTGLQ
jgi:hypothetical protein